VDGQVYTAASAVRWLVDMGLIGSAAELDSVAASDAADVMCHPTFAGAAAPWWRSDATAAFTGLTLASTPGHLVRAVLEGIAAQVAVTLSAVEADLGNPMSVLRVDGGLTRSATLMQAQADIAQMPVELYPGAHATAVGVAAAAHLSLDPTLSLADAVGGWKPERVFEPRWSGERADRFTSSWTRTLERLLQEGNGQ
jgi:glycerol kinase